MSEQQADRVTTLENQLGQMATEISMLAAMMQQHFTAPIPPRLSSPTPIPTPTSSPAMVKAPKIALPKPFDGELRNGEMFLHQLNLYIIG